jgi:hypothetical protein
MNKASSFSKYSLMEANASEVIYSITLLRGYVDYDNRPKKAPIERTDLETKLQSLGLISPVPDLEDFTINQITIKYKMDAVYNKFGISDIKFNLVSAIIQFEYMIPVGEEDSETIEIEIVEDSPEIRLRTTTEIEKLPFEPKSVLIDMKGGWDKSKFNYHVNIGD